MANASTSGVRALAVVPSPLVDRLLTHLELLQPCR